MEKTPFPTFQARWRIKPLRVLAALFAVLFIALTLFTVDTLRRLPQAQATTPPETPAVVLLTQQGEAFARRGVRRERPVDARELPPHVTQAFIAIEDRRFYHHHGVDVRGVLRAAWRNARGGGLREGGSTITQQLVKNTLVGNDRTMGRKAREAVAALWLDQRRSKPEILSDYLNTVYFGDGAYGIAAASRTYFDKAPAELTLSEAALLAGLVKAPSQLAPTRSPGRAFAREQVVLRAMVQEGYVSEMEAARAVPPRIVRSTSVAPWGGHFADWTYGQVRPTLEPGYGEVVMHTMLDGHLQRLAEAVMKQTLARSGRGGPTQGAIVALRRDGSVAAMVGGRDYATSPFNRVTQARRQPGSAFKVFTYLAAFRAGAAPDTLVSDGPLKIGNWAPQNADHANHGMLTLEQAFASSSNLAAIRVSQAVSPQEVVRAARDLGVASKLDPVPSLTLGTSAVTLLEMTAAYTAVSAGAYPIVPTPVATTEAPRQMPMDWEREQSPMLRLLQAAAEDGTGRAAALPVASYGKTGTSQNYRDAVFIGFAEGLTVGVWVGNDDATPMTGIAGGALPAQIWRAFMTDALSDEIAQSRLLPSEAPDTEEPSWEEEAPPAADRLWRWFRRFGTHDQEL